jgi:hypothetical protein
MEKLDDLFIWKLKGICTKVVLRIFSKYGNPLFVSDEDKDFGKFFN